MVPITDTKIYKFYPNVAHLLSFTSITVFISLKIEVFLACLPHVTSNKLYEEMKDHLCLESLRKFNPEQDSDIGAVLCQLSDQTNW